MTCTRCGGGPPVETELGGAAAVHLALFTARGEADETVREEVDAGRVLLFTADDLFEK